MASAKSSLTLRGLASHICDRTGCSLFKVTTLNNLGPSSKGYRLCNEQWFCRPAMSFENQNILAVRTWLGHFRLNYNICAHHAHHLVFLECTHSNWSHKPLETLKPSCFKFLWPLEEFSGKANQPKLLIIILPGGFKCRASNLAAYISVYIPPMYTLVL